MDEDLVDETLDSIEVLYRQGDRDEALSVLTKIKNRVDALVEDLS
jgi:hypothetical protein